MKRAWLYPVLILAATLLTYANSFSGPFISMTCLGLPKIRISDISGLYGIYYKRLPAAAVHVGH